MCIIKSTGINVEFLYIQHLIFCNGHSITLRSNKFYFLIQDMIIEPSPCRAAISKNRLTHHKLRIMINFGSGHYVHQIASGWNFHYLMFLSMQTGNSSDGDGKGQKFHNKRSLSNLPNLFRSSPVNLNSKDGSYMNVSFLQHIPTPDSFSVLIASEIS